MSKFVYRENIFEKISYIGKKYIVNFHNWENIFEKNIFEKNIFEKNIFEKKIFEKKIFEKKILPKKI